MFTYPSIRSPVLLFHSYLIKMSQKGKIGIVGSGLIGSSWAMLFAAAGYEVKLYDSEEKQISAALENILPQLEKLSSDGVLRGTSTPAQQFSLIQGVTSLEACVQDAKYVQECVPEILELKIKVFKEIDQIASLYTILASSTSCIQPSMFTSELKNKSNCIIAHPVNPPYYVPLVEVVPAPWTSADVVDKTKKLMTEIGQSPVVLSRECPGFALNRIQYAIFNECLRLHLENILSIEDIDKVMTDGLARRYVWQGPMETGHMNAPKGFDDYIEIYGKGIMNVSKNSEMRVEWTKENLQGVTDQLEKIVPVKEIKEKSKWRNERLGAFSKFQQDFSSSGSS